MSDVAPESGARENSAVVILKYQIEIQAEVDPRDNYQARVREMVHGAVAMVRPYGVHVLGRHVATMCEQKQYDVTDALRASVKGKR